MYSFEMNKVLIDYFFINMYEVFNFCQAYNEFCVLKQEQKSSWNLINVSVTLKRLFPFCLFEMI